MSPYSNLVSLAGNLVVLSAEQKAFCARDEIDSAKPTTPVLEGTMSLLAADIILGARSDSIQAIHSRLRTILPEQINGELVPSVGVLSGLIKLDMNVQYFSLAMYLISNNMLEDLEIRNMVRSFQSQAHQRFLTSLLSAKTLAVEAFAEKLLMVAAEVDNPMVLKL